MNIADLSQNQRYDAESHALLTDDGPGTLVEFTGPEIAGSEEFDENLAESIPEDVLARLGGDLIKEIEDDDRSRDEWLQMRDKAMGLLGLKLNPPRGDIASGGAPLEGMSTYQDSTLLDASLRFQANARGELLPSGGPVKVHNDGEPVQQNEDEAEALEKAVNKFLTVTATEYVPDSDRLFFQVGWAGCGFKKGYHCPVRRRPVIESIDAKDLIISAEATDIDNAERITQKVSMSPSVMKRMQLAGAYREVELSHPSGGEKTIVDRRIESLQGVTKTSILPENLNRTLYECYANLDIPGHEHELDGEETGLPVPYKVTIDKDSNKILEIRRNWKEGDEMCTKRKTFVMYPFAPAFGFYPIGLMHILGNATNAVTAAYRIAIDNGMFGNFPAFLYAKSGTGQDKNDFRAGPGQGIPVNVDAAGKLSDKVSPLPYKQTDPSFVQFMQNIKQDAQRMGGTADTQVGEGNQNAPVGTTIALIEQAQKVMSAVHKRMHQAQAEEFRMLRELLREDPEALWRHAGEEPFNKDTIIAALNNCELTPQADPNIASHMIRMARAEAAKMLVKENPQMWDIKSATEWYCDQISIPDIKRFILPPPPPGSQPPAQDPNAVRAMSTMAAANMRSQDAAQDRELKSVELAQKAHDAAQDRQMRVTEQQTELAKELVIHPLSQAIVNQMNPTQGQV